MIRNRTQTFAVVIIAAFLASQNSTALQAQRSQTPSSEQQIRATINDYIVGTAYNHADQLRSAFLPGANMFLDHKDKPLFIMKIEEYADRVAKQEQGKFNGRVTNILSIDCFEGIAFAKLEVTMPSMDRRFIDLLLLKRLENGWKIISKTAASQTSNKRGHKVLLVVSNAQRQGDSDLPAGNSFSEIAIAYDGYQAAGYHVDLVSPNGGSIPLTNIDPADELQRKHLYDADFMFALKNTRMPSEIKADDYDIVQFTGGSSPIFDVPQNSSIQQLVMQIYEKNNGVIAAVCHGTAGLVHLKTSDGKFLINGKRVNGVPDTQARKKLPDHQHYPFVIEEMLRQRGGNFQHSEDGVPHVEIDGRLVTGQNSLSSKQVTEKSIEISRKNMMEDTAK